VDVFILLAEEKDIKKSFKKQEMLQACWQCVACKKIKNK